MTNINEINFVDTDAEKIKRELIEEYEKLTNRTLYPADPMRLFILWFADVLAQMLVLVNDSAKQNLLRFARGENLDALSELFKDAHRLAPSSATTMLRYTLSAPQIGHIIIPAGSRVMTEGDLIFKTASTLSIPPGELSGEVMAECVQAGVIGNDYLPGQITTMVDLIKFVDQATNITKSEGGAEQETDEAFYERIRSNTASYSTAGSMGAYEYFAKTSSPIVSDARATSKVPGKVDVKILLQDGELPSADMIEQTRLALSADKIRPLTDDVTVAAPDTVGYEIDLTYYIAQSSESLASQIIKDAEDAVQEYIRWQGKVMGRDINPSVLHSMVMAAGAKRVDLRKPAFVSINDLSVAQLNGEPNVINGGLEDD